jgi:hypothetical protein
LLRLSAACCTASSDKHPKTRRKKPVSFSLLTRKASEKENNPSLPFLKFEVVNRLLPNKGSQKPGSFFLHFLLFEVVEPVCDLLAVSHGLDLRLEERLFVLALGDRELDALDL